MDQAQADFIQAIALNDKMDVYYYNLRTDTVYSRGV